MVSACGALRVIDGGMPRWFRLVALHLVQYDRVNSFCMVFAYGGAAIIPCNLSTH